MVLALLGVSTLLLLVYSPRASGQVVWVLQTGGARIRDLLRLSSNAVESAVENRSDGTDDDADGTEYDDESMAGVEVLKEQLNEMKLELLNVQRKTMRGEGTPELKARATKLEKRTARLTKLFRLKAKQTAVPADQSQGSATMPLPRFGHRH